MPNMYEVIKAEAKRKKMTVNQLELSAQMARGTISKWAKCSPTLSSLDKVAAVLDIKTSTLVEKASKK